MKTLFLTWKKVGTNIWAAKDPIDNLRRWIIRRIGEQYELLWVKLNSEHHVDTHADFTCLQWHAVSYRLKQLADTAFSHNWNIPAEDQEKAKELLLNMFEKEDSELIPPHLPEVLVGEDSGV